METIVNYTSEMLMTKTSTEVRQIASDLKIKNYTKFPKLLLINKILQTQKVDEVVNKEEKVAVKKNITVSSEQKRVKGIPKPGSKTESIFIALKEGKKSMYRIAKDLNTYVPMVISVKRRYLSV
jgi:phage antirepressor YoqD-like protein